MQEQFSYSVMASGLGILIVFSLLVMLSGLMVLIRKLSDGTEKKTANAAPKTKSKGASSSSVPLPVLVAAAAAASGIEVDTPEWLPAAVAAFLASEDDAAVTPLASNWHSSHSAKYDPWVANNKLSKTAPGA